MRLQGGKRFLLCVDLFCQRTGKGGICQRRPLSAVCGDQVHHRLCLRQAQLAVQKSTAGVLAGCCRLCSRCKTRLHQPLRHRIAAVAGQLHHILAGVAVRGTEKQCHTLVKGLALLHKIAEQCRIALCLPHLFGGICRKKHLFCHSIALCAGQAHHCNAPCSGSCGDGGNGCFLHGKFSSFRRDFLSGGHSAPIIISILPRFF